MHEVGVFVLIAVPAAILLMLDLAFGFTWILFPFFTVNRKNKPRLFWLCEMPWLIAIAASLTIMVAKLWQVVRL